MNISLSAFAPENLVSRDGFGSPVPRQFLLHTQAESGAYSRDSSRFSRRRPFIYLNRHTPSGQSRVYRVTQLRTDGVHYRESAGTGPVVLKVVPVTGATFAGHHGPINVRLSFPTSTFGRKCTCVIHKSIGAKYRTASTGRPGSSEVPRNPLTRWDVSSIPANGIFLTKKLKKQTK